jgi:hypothetical protein
MRNKLLLLALLALIVLDVLGNFLCAVGAALWRSMGSLRKAAGSTLSATAWGERNHPVFSWCYRAIDIQPWFGAGHCQAQFEREQKFGSVWAAWHNEFTSKE